MAASRELRATAVSEDRSRPSSREVVEAVDADRVGVVLTAFMDGLDGRWLPDGMSTDDR